MVITSLAFEFILITTCRTGEDGAARWDEVDFVSNVWTIPAERMKAVRVHRVPMCTRANEILGLLKAKAKMIFISQPLRPKNKHISLGSCLVAMKRKTGYEGYTPDGLRSTFRDWAAETTGFANETPELAHAHSIQNKAEAAYRRQDQLEKRAKLMEQWQQYVDTTPKIGNVVLLQKKVR